MKANFIDLSDLVLIPKDSVSSRSLHLETIDRLDWMGVVDPSVRHSRTPCMNNYYFYLSIKKKGFIMHIDCLLSVFYYFDPCQFMF